MLKNIKRIQGTIDYQTPYHWEARGVTREIQMQRLRFAKKYIKKGDTVLDIGCGDGFLTNALSSACEEVTGIDASLTGISLSQSMIDNSKIYLACGLAGNLPFKGNAFDVVTLFEVIEHIPVTSLKDVMKEIKRVLKEEGMLIVTTPNPRNLRNRILGKNMVSAKHEKEYNQVELLELFKDFLKVELSGIYLPLPPLSLLYKPCYRFMWQILFPLAKYCPNLALFTALCGRKR